MTISNPGAIATVVGGGSPGHVMAEWGNAIRDRVVNNFSNTTDRDAAITSPVAGMMCCVSGMPWVYTGSAWRGLPGGVIGYVAVTSSQGSITTIVDLTSLTITFTALADRRYRVTGFVANFTS